jgi:hypothetical protein
MWRRSLLLFWQKEWTMTLDELRLDGAIKQKKGLHFILASIIIWCFEIAFSLLLHRQVTQLE